jgi:hypothetical protein
MKFKHLLICGAALACAVGLADATQAATLDSGDLIRASGTETQGAVYYYGGNGKRYVFPNEKTYKTWYPDFSSVKTITLAELQTLPLGGNVTYKPGARLVKITTDPKVYAVDAHSTLRWVETEAIAAALYGADWNTKVDDIPDAFFINYKVGTPISSAGSFSPAAAGLAATDIDTDLQLTTMTCTSCNIPPPTTTTSTPPAATSTPETAELEFTVSKNQAQAGDVINLNASAATNDGVAKIELFFDGSLVKTCASNYCSGEIQIPIAGTKSAYVSEAKLTKLNLQTVSRTQDIAIQANGSDKISLKVGQAQIRPNQLASVSADVSNTIDIQRIDIYVDGTIVKSCVSGSQLCSWADYLQDQTLGSVHPVKAAVTDKIGRLYTSEALEIKVSDNDSPAVSVLPAKTMIYVGETLDVTVSATDNDGIASISILKDGVVLKHCAGAAPCTVSTGPWDAAGATLTFEGRAEDPKGASGQAVSQKVSVIQP